MGVLTKNQSSDCALEAPERNHYFHGKMLDVRHFQLETEYHNGKRQLINRLVLGYGVVCGLGVRQADADPPSVIVEPGLAIDCWGREMIVDVETQPIEIPPELVGKPPEDGPGEGDTPRQEDPDCPPEPPSEHEGLHLVLCYHECLTEPTPVLAGDCRDEEPCQPGVIRERYRLEFRPGCLPLRDPQLALPDVIKRDGRVDYQALVKAISEPCPCPEDPCIPLANLHLEFDGPHCTQDIDISIRPIVYTNDLLFQLILSTVVEVPSYRRGK